MKSLIAQWRPTSIFPTQFSRNLIYGYGFIVLLILSAALGFKLYDQNVSSKLQQAENLYQIQSLIDKHLSLARERSLTLVKMFNTEDPFEIDALQQRMMQLEHQIGLTRQQISQALQSKPNDLQLFNQTAELVKNNKAKQTEVFNRIMADDRNAAMRILVEETLPTQEEVVEHLLQLKNSIKQQANQAKNGLNSLLSEMGTLVLLAAAVPVGAILLIGWVSVHRIQRYEQEQKALVQQQQSTIEKRTHALELDKALFQQINDAIVLASQEGELIQTNYAFELLKKAFKLSEGHHQYTLWHLLERLFTELPTSTILQQLKLTGIWRDEVSLKRGGRHFLMTVSYVKTPLDEKPCISVILTDISEIKYFQQQLERTAKTDTVTQLANRFALNERLESHLLNHADQPFTLFSIDLDHFKAINDHFGHEEGDRLLREMANILKTHSTACAKEAMNARIGGDEFIIFIPELLSDQAISQTCERILIASNAISRQWDKLGFGCSIGVVRYPQDGQTLDALMRHADYAMYEAKKAGRNHYVLFNKRLQEKIDYASRIEANMKEAIQKSHFQVYLQPQFELKTLSLCGAEALLRWPTDEGMISPVEFIPMAEKFGLINALGDFVMEESIRGFCEWQKQSNALPRIAINISAIQIATSHLGPVLKNLLQKYPIQPDQIDFEITESVLMENTGNKYPCLSFLENLGSEISIDDFGTGYSSLAYIQNLQCDRIKIDRSFVKGLQAGNHSYQIIRAIIQMAHSLGLKVLAEGIETLEQLRLLQELDCDEGQGFYFSPPIPQAAFEQNYIQPSLKKKQEQPQKTSSETLGKR